MTARPMGTMLTGILPDIVNSLGGSIGEEKTGACIAVHSFTPWTGLQIQIVF